MNERNRTLGCVGFIFLKVPDLAVAASRLLRLGLSALLGGLFFLLLALGLFLSLGSLGLFALRIFVQTDEAIGERVVRYGQKCGCS